MRRILVVDDEPELREQVKARLEHMGYAVLTASDGEEAIAVARREKPDLILLDVLMPKLNGYQVCRELKSHPETQATPVLMLTAKAQEGDRFWGQKTGADDYITKPFTMGILVQKVQQYLGERDVKV
jgi:DNA-binding response OmpR family regulator